MKTLYIHAGFGKCGSSSIQRFLSHQGQFKCQNADKLIYAALFSDGLLYGKELVQKLTSNSHGYVSSFGWDKLAASPSNYFDVIEQELLKLLQNHHIVLSCEGWAEHFSIWDDIGFFKRHNIKTIFIFYIRPPVEWLNSAWWQWGAWSGMAFDNWLGKNIPHVHYASKIKPFQTAEWVSQVRVRLLGQDLLADFSDLLGLSQAPTPPQAIANKSLPNSLLRLFQLHPHLRPGPDNSAIDFVLEKHLALEGKPDWVLNPAQISHIIGHTRQSNLELIELGLLDEDCQAAFKADSRYWNESAFKDKPAQPATGVPPTSTELEQISLACIEAIMKLERQQRPPNYDNAKIWRDLALHVENSDLNLAYKLMKQAYKLRPDGPYIKRKLAEYESKL